MSKRSVLITGCSDGGLGSALALAFHKAGYRVLATARNPSKMAAVESAGIEMLTLDVLSETSLKECVVEVGKLTGGSLYALVNNAGAGYSMPVVEMDLAEAKKLFDLNVWSPIATTQAFLPLLLQSKGGALLVNNTSVGSVMGVPFQGAYGASKAAAAQFSEVMRRELAPFNIKVIDLKTGTVNSKFHSNNANTVLRPDSLYGLARDRVEAWMRGDKYGTTCQDSNEWATQVVRDLSQTHPPPRIWRGGNAFQMWLSTFLPVTIFDSKINSMTGLDEVARKFQEQNSTKTP